MDVAPALDADEDADAEADEELNELKAIQFALASAGLAADDLTMLGVDADDVKVAGELLALGLDLR